MHVLYVHRNFPAQFGHIAAHVSGELGWRCTFVSEAETDSRSAIEHVRYEPQGGATAQSDYFTRTFENAIAHARGVYQACVELGETTRPDLIVGHSGFGSTLFLPEVFPGVPIINLFEYFYRPHDSDLDFRPDYPPLEQDVLRSRARNAMIMLDLAQCTRGYAPTQFQRDIFPDAYARGIEVIHDGIDTSFWKRRNDPAALRERLGLVESHRIVTYCARGLESMRGFDVFMRAAKRIYERDDCVRFIVVGSDTVSYGGDLRFTGGRSFREHALSADDYDLSRFRFLGTIAPDALAQVFSLSDAHVYLTVPFVLSWSMLNAMSCGCAIVGSDTAPVREVIVNGENGVLCDFFDEKAIAESVSQILENTDERRVLGEAASATIHDRYGLEVTLPRMIRLYQSAVEV